MHFDDRRCLAQRCRRLWVVFPPTAEGRKFWVGHGASNAVLILALFGDIRVRSPSSVAAARTEKPPPLLNGCKRTSLHQGKSTPSACTTANGSNLALPLVKELPGRGPRARLACLVPPLVLSPINSSRVSLTLFRSRPQCPQA